MHIRSILTAKLKYARKHCQSVDNNNIDKAADKKFNSKLLQQNKVLRSLNLKT